MINVEDCLERCGKQQSNTIEQCGRRRNSGKWKDNESHRESHRRKKNLMEKFIRETDKVRTQETWNWLKDRNVEEGNREIVNDCLRQSLRTSNAKVKIDNILPLCRLLRERAETISHGVAVCELLTEKQ